MSAVDPKLPFALKPRFNSGASVTEPPNVLALIKHLGLQKHPEGGYFVETDRDPLHVPNPFHSGRSSQKDDSTRSASTTIYYLLSPGQPQGVFHRNKGRTMHTLHKGRGRYVIIHANEKIGEGFARIETFIVGHDIQRGERLQWMVEGGKYKASFLLPDRKDGTESEGLLISEVVVPGFEFSDHDFMPASSLPKLVSEPQAKELQ